MLKLEPEGMVYYRDGVAVRFDRQETQAIWGVREFPDDIPAPEVVHLEASARCNLDCPYCYVEKTGEELSAAAWMHIVDELAEVGGFGLEAKHLSEASQSGKLSTVSNYRFEMRPVTGPVCDRELRIIAATSRTAARRLFWAASRFSRARVAGDLYIGPGGGLCRLRVRRVTAARPSRPVGRASRAGR